MVDDDRDLSETLAVVLAEYEYEVECAWDGVTALERLRGWTPAVIVLDLRMPRMNGLEFLEERAGNEALAGIPVVVLSADAKMSAQARSMNADAVLEKPVHLFPLVDAIRRAGARAQAA